MDFLWEPVLNKDFTNERRIGVWLYAILTDQLLEEAVKQLPEAEGISQTERKRRLDQIDRDIKGLEDKLEKLLA